MERGMMKKIWTALGRSEPMITLTLDTWSQLREYIAKASSLATVATQHDFDDKKTTENYLWALSDFLNDAEDVMDGIDVENSSSRAPMPTEAKDE